MSSASTLDCPICLECFDDSSHCPMVFPCGHSLCQSCLSTLQPPNQCPSCRKTGQCSKNFMLMEAVKQLKERAPTLVKVEMLCESCEEKEAARFCSSCSSSGLHYCDECDQQQHQKGAFKAHNRVGVKEKVKFVVQMCPEHPGHPVTHYCHTENKAICSTCKDAKKYCAEHKYDSVVDVRTELVEAAEQRRERMERRMERHKQNIFYRGRASQALQELVAHLHGLVAQLEAVGGSELESNFKQLAPVFKSYTSNAAFVESYIGEAGKLLKDVKQGMTDANAVANAQRALGLLQQAEEMESKDLAGDERQFQSAPRESTQLQHILKTIAQECKVPEMFLGDQSRDENNQKAKSNIAYSDLREIRCFGSFPGDSSMSRINIACVSPDSQILATGSSDGIIRLRNVSNGLEMWKRGHSNSVLSLCFSPVGRTVASGSNGQTIRLWDISNGTQIRELNGHLDSVVSLCFSSDGQKLASGSKDSSICIWNASNWTLIRQFEEHTSTVLSVRFSSDARILASGSKDNSIILWDVLSGTKIRKLNRHSQRVNSVAFSPNGETLACGSADKTISLWSVSAGKLLRVLSEHTEDVTGVWFSPDGRTLASSGKDKSIILWNVSDGAVLSKFSCDTNEVNSVSFFMNGKLRVISSDQNVRFWNQS